MAAKLLETIAALGRGRGDRSKYRNEAHGDVDEFLRIEMGKARFVFGETTAPPTLQLPEGKLAESLPCVLAQLAL